MFGITTRLILIQHQMCLSLINIISISSCDCGSLQLGKKWMVNKEKDECTLWHFTIESSYVSLAITTSQSSCSSGVKSPPDDQVVDFSFTYIFDFSFIFDLALSLLIPTQHVK